MPNKQSNTFYEEFIQLQEYTLNFERGHRMPKDLIKFDCFILKFKSFLLHFDYFSLLDRTKKSFWFNLKLFVLGI